MLNFTQGDNEIYADLYWSSHWQIQKFM